MTASELFIANAVKTTGDTRVESAAAQMHTGLAWLAETGVYIPDRARLNEARLTVVDNG
jgi:hypothetical protein